MNNKRPKPDTKTIELLAPAGSAETARAAILAGADAVYIGGTRFGARAYADNPMQDELLELLDYIHLRGKKLYLTVNTLLKEQEIRQELYDYLAPLYAAGLDAVIVQDPGVMRFVLREFPKMAVHASTQMTITGPSGARMLEKCGVTRVVTARELSLEEISAIRKATHLEIESFVHGALCYCYSGRCLLSSMLGGRSGNRGRCAQPCRLPYEVWQDGKKMNRPEENYILSPKDMCTVSLLPEILKAGVTSLKIEGRMKKPEYTAGVVSIYRKYLDQCLDGRFHGVSAQDQQMLFDLYNRDGFHEGYYKQHNGRHMMALKNEKLKKTAKDRNEQLFAKIHADYCEKKSCIPAAGLAGFCEGEPMSLWLSCKDTSVCVTGSMVMSAKTRPMEEDQVKKQLQKTGDSDFDLSELSVEMRGSAFAPVKEINSLRREGIRMLRQEMLAPYRRTLGTRPENITKEPLLSSGAGDFTVLVQTKEQLQAVLESDLSFRRIYIEYTLWRTVQEMVRTVREGSDCEWALAFPQMLRESYRDRFAQELPVLEKEKFDGYLVRTMEELCLCLEKNVQTAIYLDDCMYTMSRETLDFYREMGVAGFTAPAELNRKELMQRDNRDSEICVYGRQILMVSAQCVRKNTAGCDHKSGILALKDRKGAKFPAKCCCDFCYNVIYNSVPLGLLRERKEISGCGYTGYRLTFTIENKKETTCILQLFSQAVQGNLPGESIPFTKGHYQRGVE